MQFVADPCCYCWLQPRLLVAWLRLQITLTGSWKLECWRYLQIWNSFNCIFRDYLSNHPLAERSKACVCGRLHAGIAGSKPTVVIAVCPFWVRRAGRLSRGVIPPVLCHCVRSRNVKNVAAMDRVGLLCQRRKKIVWNRRFISEVLQQCLYISFIIYHYNTRIDFCIIVT